MPPPYTCHHSSYAVLWSSWLSCYPNSYNFFLFFLPFLLRVASFKHVLLSYGFSSSHAWMWESDDKEGWALKNWCFETVVWRRLLRVPSTARRSNQSILKEMNPKYSLEGLMLKLKLQYFGHLIWRADSLEKTLILGKIEGRRRRGWQGTRLFDGITDSMDMSLSELQELVRNREAWHVAVHGVANSWIRLSNWTKLIPEGKITAICINFKKWYVTIYRYWKTKRLIETFKLNTDLFFHFYKFH